MSINNISSECPYHFSKVDDAPVLWMFGHWEELFYWTGILNTHNIRHD